MQRQGNETILTADESPKILPHGSFVGLSIFFTSETSGGSIAVYASGSLDGSFEDQVSMEVGSDWMYPDTAGMNMLYNARYIMIEWDTGDIVVYQKA
jgi:hypothetical protein